MLKRFKSVMKFCHNMFCPIVKVAELVDITFGCFSLSSKVEYLAVAAFK